LLTLIQMSTQAERFASCVKKVTKTFKSSKLKTQRKYSKKEKEGIAIAICTKSILWPQGRTLKRFFMKNGKPQLVTQKRSMRSKK
jgi:hypothetical protein